MPNLATNFFEMEHVQARHIVGRPTLVQSYLYFLSMTLQGQPLHPLTFCTLMMQPLAVTLKMSRMVLSTSLPHCHELFLISTPLNVKL